MINKNNTNSSEFNPDLMNSDDPDAEVGGDKKKLDPKAIVFILFILFLLIGLFFLFSGSSEDKNKAKDEQNNSKSKLSLPSSEPPKISIFDQKAPPPPEKDDGALDLIKKRQLDFSNSEYLALKSAEELKYQQASEGLIKRAYGSFVTQIVGSPDEKQDISEQLIKKRTADTSATSTLMVSESTNSNSMAENQVFMPNTNIPVQKETSQPELSADEVDFSDLIKDEAAYMQKFNAPVNVKSKSSNNKEVNDSTLNDINEKVLGDSVNANDTELRKEPYHTTVLARKVPMNPSFFIPQGTHIRCVMETIVISDVDGPTSCIVPENIRSFNGLNVLIPKGSRVIGDYKKTDFKEERVPMIWNRLITPDNIDIALNSTGTTLLGANNLGGSVDKRWGERLFTATLISLGIDAFSWKVVDRLPKKVKTTITNGVVEKEIVDFDSTAVKNLSSFTESELKRSLEIPYRLMINQGTVGSIFVARDLDFSGVYSGEKGFKY